MAVASIEELRRAFEDADPARILGTPESGWVDFKSQPYLVSTDRGAWELCKDVAGLANANGGCIVIGIATEKDENDATERAESLRAVPIAMCNRDQHRDRIVAGVFPVIDGLQLAAYPSSTEGAACYLVIYVPAQSTDVRPFLVRYLLGSDDRRVSGFGWPVRVDDAITWHGCEQFQNRLSLGGLLQSAMAHSRALQRFEPSQDVLGRYTRVVEAMDVKDPVLVLQFLPRSRVDLTLEMYGTEGIASAVRERKPLRHNGFNTIAHTHADIRTDRGIAWGSRWRTSIDSDGVLVAAVPATDAALGWTNQSRRSGVVISPLFLLEWTNDVFRTFYEVVQRRTHVPHDHWTAQLIALGMQRGHVAMPHRVPHFIDDDQVGRPNSDDFRREYDPTGDANRDTFSVMKLFYALFGFGADAIPFCQDGAFAPDTFREAAARR